MVSFRAQKPLQTPVEKTQLQLAFAKAMAFDPASIPVRLDNNDIKMIAQEEAAFKDVHVPESGIPAAAAAHLVGPALAGVRQWRLARSRFDSEIEPKMADLTALHQVEDRIHEVRAEGAQARAQAESVWMADSRNSRARTEHDEAEARLTLIKQAHGNAAPNMMSYNPVYYGLMLSVNAAECLINYDILLMFTGIPAIAAGATLLLGFALAYAAHAHGTILRQGSYRFDRARSPAERASSWRELALATAALIVVIGMAAGSRYEVVMRTVVSQMKPNLLGAAAMIDANPMRDVLLSLLANLIAWIVGVFIAFYFHDPDPEFMKAQRQYDTAWKALRSRRKDVELEIESIEAKFQRRVEELRQSAKARLNGVADENAMLGQITKHQQSILQAFIDSARANADDFRTALCRLALASPASVRLSRAETGEPLSPADYRNMPLDVETLIKGEVA